MVELTPLREDTRNTLSLYSSALCHMTIYQEGSWEESSPWTLTMLTF